MKMKKVTALSLAAVLAMGTLGFSVTAYAEDPAPSIKEYTVTIPKTLDLADNHIGPMEGDGMPIVVKVTSLQRDDDDFEGTLRIGAAARSTPEKKTPEDATKCFLINENDATAKIPYEWEFTDGASEPHAFEPIELSFKKTDLPNPKTVGFKVNTMIPTKPDPDDPTKPVQVDPDELAVGVYKDVVAFTVSVANTTP